MKYKILLFLGLFSPLTGLCSSTFTEKEQIYDDFKLAFSFSGMGSNYNSLQPVFTVTGKAFAYTLQQNSAIDGEFTKTPLTVCSGFLRESSIDSIINIVHTIKDTLIYRSNPSVMSGGIHFLSVSNNEVKVNFRLHNTSHPKADQIVNVLNSNIPANQQKLTLYNGRNGNYIASSIPLPLAYKPKETKKPEKLPKINSISYLKLNTEFDSFFKNGAALIDLKYYSEQLSNIGNYEVFYTKLSCPANDDPVAQKICNELVSLTCGFLFFYDRDTKHAQVVNVMNNFYIDSGVSTNFSLDENNGIHVIETGMTDSDVGENEPMVTEYFPLSKHIIEIDANGVINIKEVE